MKKEVEKFAKKDYDNKTDLILYLITDQRICGHISCPVQSQKKENDKKFW